MNGELRYREEKKGKSCFPGELCATISKERSLSCRSIGISSPFRGACFKQEAFQGKICRCSSKVVLLITGFSVKIPPKSWWKGLVGASFFG